MRPSLRQCAQFFHVDKFERHSYIPKYDALFKDFRCVKMLEIGIGYEDLMKPFVSKYIHGASLKMWRDFFPGAHIYGCDIRADVLFDDEERIFTFQCDQGNVRSLIAAGDFLGAPLDLVIDDGSHVTFHQRTSALVLLPYLRKGGIYVIEDVWPDTGLALATEFEGEFILGNNTGDDNLVVIRR